MSDYLPGTLRIVDRGRRLPLARAWKRSRTRLASASSTCVGEFDEQHYAPVRGFSNHGMSPELMARRDVGPLPF
jgi:hypothetical protein